jgi:hypothetical protein
MVTAMRRPNIKILWDDWVAPLVTWVAELTKGERALLFAVLFLGAVGAYGTHAFFAESRGSLVGWLAAIGIELLYLGSAGVAVKQPGQIWLARGLMVLGALGSAFFNVLVGLRERMPMLFAQEPRWPTWEQLVVHGTVSLMEGVIIPLSALMIALLLHSIASHRLIAADDKELQIQVRRELKPFGCPFCPAAFDTPAKLYGHYGRCQDAQGSELSSEERRAIVARAVSEGQQRLLEG